MARVIMGASQRRVVGDAVLSRMRAAGGAMGVQAVRTNTAVAGYSLPDLDYDYGELEPAISGDIMKLHHSKHHQTYITGFNQALEKLDKAHADKDAVAIVNLQSALKFNGGETDLGVGLNLKSYACKTFIGEGAVSVASIRGILGQFNPGHVNHSIFWKNLAPTKEGGGEPPEGSLAAAIDAEFGGLDALKAKLTAGGAGVQGSGWVWLGLNKELKKLVVDTTPNQDPLVTKGLIPLLGIDVWEHAYYLQYKNVRPDYLKNIFKVINWKDVASRYEANV